VVNNAAIIRDAFIFKAEPALDAVLDNLTGAYRLLAAASRDARAGKAAAPLAPS